MRADTIEVWERHNDNTKTKLILNFIMKRYSSETGDTVAEENHISTSPKELFRGEDLSEIYESKKASLLSSISKVELNGSGWVLDRIIKLIVRIYDYRPLSNVNARPQAPLNINDDDRAGTYLDIGDFLRNK